MASETVTVCQIAFTTGPLDPTPNWVDVSSRVLADGYQIKRGRQTALDRTQTDADGQMRTCELLEAVRRFAKIR